MALQPKPRPTGNQNRSNQQGQGTRPKYNDPALYNPDEPASWYRKRRKKITIPKGQEYGPDYELVPGSDEVYQRRIGEEAFQRPGAMDPSMATQWIEKQALGLGYQGQQGQQALGAHQQALASQMMARARGEAPSIAQMAGQQALGQAVGQQLAMARSAPGVSPAQAQRMAMMGQAQAAGDIGQKTAMYAMQERQQAEAAAANMLARARQQDLAAQQAGIAHMAGLSAADREALMQREQMLMQQNLGMQNIAQGHAAAQGQGGMNVGGAIGTGLGAIGGSFIPGVGTLAGGAIGGAIGSAIDYIF